MDGLKGFGSGFSGFSGMKKSPLRPMATGTKKRLQETIDAEVRDLMRDANITEREAKMILRLQVQFPVMSVIEAIAYNWLRRKNYEFIYQAPVAGGRGRLGGSIVDFLVLLDTEWVAWAIQGYYFHQAIGQLERDASARFTVLASEYQGIGIKYYAEIWEYPILDQHRRDHTFELALLGVEVGKI